MTAYKDTYDPTAIPLASVIIITHNRPETLRAAIQSVFDQTLKNWELIVLDYTENESVNESVRMWATKDSRVRWRWNEKNINNIAYCWNEGLDISRGKYWCTLDDDNVKYPAFLEKMTAYLDAHPEKETVVCRCEINSPAAPRSIMFSKPASFRAILNMNHVDSGQCIHRKSLLDKIGYFDEAIISFEDWDYMLRIYNLDNQSGNAFGWLDESGPLCCYYKHIDQRTYDPAIQATYANSITAVRGKNRNIRQPRTLKDA